MEPSHMRTAAILALAIALAGCSLLRAGTAVPITHADPYPANPTGDWDAVLVIMSADGDQTEVTVDEALTLGRGGELLLVRGALLVDDAYGQVWLCSRVEQGDDSVGPQCGGAILLVANESAGAGLLASEYIAALLETGAMDGLQVSGTVRWSADAAFLGRIR